MRKNDATVSYNDVAITGSGSRVSCQWRALRLKDWRAGPAAEAMSSVRDRTDEQDLICFVMLSADTIQ